MFIFYALYESLGGGGVNLGLIRSVLWSKDCECAEQLPSGVI